MRKETLVDIILEIGEKSTSFTSQDVLIKLQNKFSRQHVVQTLRKLLNEKRLIKTGSTRGARYSLPHKAHFLFPTFEKGYPRNNLKEGEVFLEFEKRLPQIDTLPNNARRVLNYTFTEILNNAIDHSQAKKIHVKVTLSNKILEVEILDNGIGVFRNIMQKFRLPSELEAVQQLAKGKLTTLPDKHSGQGIFFSSKAADIFELDSYGHKLIVNNHKGDFALHSSHHSIRGTKATFTINSETPVILKDIFLKYQTQGVGGPFDITHIIVKLYAFGTDFLSRSEAKRILERLETFNCIILDFENVQGIGQAFADQVFRVFQNQHPDLEIKVINANETVQFMIDRTIKEKTLS